MWPFLFTWAKRSTELEEDQRQFSSYKRSVQKDKSMITETSLVHIPTVQFEKFIELAFIYSKAEFINQLKNTNFKLSVSLTKLHYDTLMKQSHLVKSLVHCCPQLMPTN